MAPSDRRYHHGNLRAALTDAAVGLARAGGPDAVVLRAVTKAAGVSPNAAYRHFADHESLLLQVVVIGLTELGQAMQRAVAAAGAVSTDDDAAKLARRRLRAVGRAYVEYALAEPGLFRTAFSSHTPAPVAGSEPYPARADGGGPLLDPETSPYLLLGQALDGLVRAGTLSPGRRAGAEATCWSAVHGFAALCLDGPLAALTDDEREVALDALLDTVDRGL